MATEFTSPQHAPYSLYFGGGTPSLLSYQQISHLVETVTTQVGYSPIETTLECNPTLTEHHIEALLQAGINRISVGIQSTDPSLLRKLGRTHTAHSMKDILPRAQQAGMNVSVDFMTGIPGADLKQTMHDISHYLFADHVSLYLLSLTESHPLYELLDEDFQTECFHMAEAYLQQNDFYWYEISNFAKKGKESFHNTLYWNGAMVYGLGPGACGKGAKTRYRNKPDLYAYIHKNGLPAIKIDEILSPEDIQYEALLLPLRTAAGLSHSAITLQPLAIQNRIASLQSQGILELNHAGNVMIAPHYRLLYNEIIHRLTDC